MASKRKVWIARFGIALSIVLVSLFVKGIQWQATWTALKQANYFWLFPGMFAIIGSLVGRAYRWRVFLGEEHRAIPLRRLYNTLTIGFFGNSVLPARAGELLRPYMLARSERVRFSEAFATVVVERVFDLLAVVISLAVLLVVAPFPEEVFTKHEEELKNLAYFGWVMGAGALFLCLVLSIMVRAPERFHVVLARLTGWMPTGLQEKLLHAQESFVSGLSTFDSLGASARAVGWTILIWFTILLSEYFTILAFGFSVTLLGTMILMSLLAFSVMVPQGPGYLGPFQWASSLTLSICFAVPEAGADAYAIVLWVVQLFPIIIMGVICLHWEGLTLGQLARSVKAQEESEE
jgi:uncharacterized protein (TIRG00374 family)